MDKEKGKEKVLVLEEKIAFRQRAWQGINTEVTDQIVDAVLENKMFCARAEVEEDPSFKQISPYIIFKYQDKYLLMKRREDHTDQRLASKYSIGVGGHLREEDLTTSEVTKWGKREFEEEVSYGGKLDFRVLGILYDDSEPVGQVHLGIVMIAEGDSPNISVKNEHLMGELVSLEEVRKYYDSMENWSKIVFDHLESVVNP